MTLSTEMKKLRESKAYYAAAGARGLAAEKLRDVPEHWRKMDGMKGARRELSGRAQSYAVTLTGKAAEVYGELGSRALETYEGLAERGRHGAHGFEETAPEEIEADSATSSTQRDTADANAESTEKDA